jgi:hypothetical protein
MQIAAGLEFMRSSKAHFLCVLVFLDICDNPEEDKYMLIFICFM